MYLWRKFRAYLYFFRCGTTYTQFCLWRRFGKSPRGAQFASHQFSSKRILFKSSIGKFYWKASSIRKRCKFKVIPIDVRMPGDSIGPLYWQASNYRRKMNNLEKQLFKNFRTFIVAFRLFVWRQLQWNRVGTAMEPQPNTPKMLSKNLMIKWNLSNLHFRDPKFGI